MEMFGVLEPGPFTTVQDLGRFGFQQFGVPVSGALDRFSFRAANWLVGNRSTDAALEFTFMGPKLEVLADGTVAVCGADVPIALNDRVQPAWEGFRVSRGDVIAIRAARRGVRAYLAVSGGIDVPEIMGSRSTCIGGSFGGFEGRALVKGDVLSRGSGSSDPSIRKIPMHLRPSFETEMTLRAIPGPQDDYFEDGLDLFYHSEYKATTRADRMGYRLEGQALAFRNDIPRSIISEPSLSGVVQVPPDGQPIILLVEQTAGGYAKIATVITADLHVIAQARPGDRIRFERCDLAQAHRIFAAHRERVNLIRKYSQG
jgi:antagonist of KipI